MTYMKKDEIITMAEGNRKYKVRGVVFDGIKDKRASS